MKYTMKTLDSALDFLLPKITEAKRQGVSFPRTDLIRMVAEDFFVDSLDSEEQLDYSYGKRVAHHICAEALHDLRSTEGCFVFGEKEFSFIGRKL